MDIVKDLVQLALMIYAVGGVVYIVKNWTSFSSVVSIQRLTCPKGFLQLENEFNSFAYALCKYSR